MNAYYNENYFKSEIFNFDYEAIAKAIIEVYKPKSIIEFGCGKGDLTKSLARHGIEIIAIDGYSNPDFSKFPQITFSSLNLNDELEVTTFLSKLNSKFDIAISLEVAEHLNPVISSSLINWMTSLTDIVIFSAAVLEQGGDGHINCRPREFWYKEFQNNGFMISDKIREKLRYNKRVGPWYRHNIIDYYRLTEQPTTEELSEIINRLITSDSFASSNYYLTQRKLDYLKQVIQMQPIRLAFHFRNMLKKITGKPIVKLK